jgi:MoaA/NifB/PqqE/SkfB family radical SAM enzyme
MGGEPTIHPDFSKITKIAQKHFKTVSVFTNAINNKIQEFEPRDNDSIIYNFKFAKLLNKEKLLPEKPGRRSLEIQITSTTNTDKVVDNIS